MRLHYPIFLLGFAALLITACQQDDKCPPLKGSWKNGEGQVLVFQSNNKALWLTRFGSQVDSVPCGYQTDCTQDPIALDLLDFRDGPFAGRNLYGILEWSSDSSFRFYYEAGDSPAVRPETFPSDLTVKFVRIKPGQEAY